MRWGIIGPGTIAKEFADDLKYVETEICNIGPVLGHHKEHTDEFVEKYGGNATNSLNDFLDAKPNAVYIATPHPMHYRQAMMCLDNKIPVLCEKPLALNEKQVNGLIEASKKNKTFLRDKSLPRERLKLYETPEFKSIINNER